MGTLEANSLSLASDAIHNLSDEIGLLFLLLAYTFRTGLSGQLIRTANVMNSLGLVLISGTLVWEAAVRLSQPEPVSGMVATVTGIAAAVGNWGVARSLRVPGSDDAAIRLAYLHSVGDIFVSLAPVAAGLLTIMAGSTTIDPLIALGVGTFIAVTTLRAVVKSREELFWPERVVCGYSAEP